MADDIDRANEKAAEFNAACISDHQAKMAKRPAVSAVECEDCGEKIPEERRRMALGCTRCINCQRDYHKEQRRNP